MRAARIHQFGSPEVISYEDVPELTPGSGEVLIRVRAAGVGPWDAWIRAGKSVLPQTLPLILGADLSGTVVSRGVGTSGVAIDEDIFGVANERFVGAYAEYAVASLGRIARKPSSIDYVSSSAVPVIAVTAMQLLERARVRKGSTVLIHGGAGNVGSYAIQLAKRAEARVIASTRSEEDAAHALSLGADLAIDSITDSAGATYGPVDAVIDTVGADVHGQSFRVLRNGGSFVSAVVKPDVELAKRRDVHAEFLLVEVTAEALGRIAALIDRGELQTLVGTVLPLSRAREAHEMLDGLRAHPRGKIVLQV
jgi:NADPH:quinone reductase-like Zn-dependent oxidoreductase